MLSCLRVCLLFGILLGELVFLFFGFDFVLIGYDWWICRITLLGFCLFCFICVFGFVDCRVVVDVYVISLV